MSIIETLSLTQGSIEIDAFACLPDPEIEAKGAAVFAHGYTSSKSDVFPWATRLADEGIASIAMDLPGHYLGSFRNFDEWECFREEAHLLFHHAYDWLEKQEHTDGLCIFGGHSLGALLALKALNEWDNASEALGICVGFGHAPKERVHLFDSPFYKKTMDIRRQLVAPCIAPDVVFPWIKQEKEKLSLSGKSLYILNGKDDAVVGEGAGTRLAMELKAQDNTVFCEEPKSLPHHQPERAAAHIAAFLKKHYLQ